MEPEAGGLGVDLVVRSLFDADVAEVLGLDLGKRFGGRKGKFLGVDVAEQGFGVLEEVEPVEDPVDGAAEILGDGVDAVGV